MKADAGDDHMHPECRVKWERRKQLREELIPALIEMGITAPDRNNLLTDICRLIEKEQSKVFPGLVICPNCNNPSERCTCNKRRQS